MSSTDTGEEPTRAGALRFRADRDRAPRVLARGVGAFGDEIVRTARAAGVPVVTDPALSALISELPVGKEIPENLYRAVAGIFSLVYALRGNAAGDAR